MPFSPTLLQIFSKRYLEGCYGHPNFQILRILNSPFLRIWTRIHVKAFLVQIAGSGPIPSDPSRAAGPDQKFWSRSAKIQFLVAPHVWLACSRLFFFLEKWLLDFWKPWTSNGCLTGVLKAAFLPSKRPPYFGSPERPPGVLKAVFSRRMTLDFW